MIELPKRKQNRLNGYDYSQNGVYFLTVCVKDKKQILSRINVGEGSPLPKLTQYGKAVNGYILQITEKYPNISVEKYVIMPNHIHMLVSVYDEHFGTGNPSPTISNMVGWLKYQTARQINMLRNTPGVSVWQRSFHDHIVRGPKDYEEIRLYIDENPLRWQSDCFY